MHCTMANYSPRALPQHLVIENFIIPINSDPRNDDSLSTLDFSLNASSTPLDLGSGASLNYSGDLKHADSSANEMPMKKSNQSPTPLKGRLPPVTGQTSPRFPSASPMNTKASLLRRKGSVSGTSPGRNAAAKMRRRSDLDIATCPPPSPRRLSQTTGSQFARYKSSPLRRSSTDSISERRRSLPGKRRSTNSVPEKRRSTETTSSISSSSSSKVSLKLPQPPSVKKIVPQNKPGPVSILRRGVFHSGLPLSCSSPIKSPSTSSRRDRLSIRFSPWRARRRVTFDISSDESSVDYSTAESSMQFSDILRTGGGGGNGDYLDDDLQGSGSINSFGFGNVSIGGGAMNESFFMMGGMSDEDLGPTSLQAMLPFEDDCDDENSRFGHLYEEELQLKSDIVSYHEGNDAAESSAESGGKDDSGDDDSVSISSAEDSYDEDDVSISSANDEDPILGDLNPRSARVRAIERIKSRINLPPPTPRRKQRVIAESVGTNWDSIPLVSPHPLRPSREESVSNDSESVSPKGVQEFPEGSQGSPEGLMAKQAESGMIFSP